MSMRLQSTHPSLALLQPDLNLRSGGLIREKVMEWIQVAILGLAGVGLPHALDVRKHLHHLGLKRLLGLINKDGIAV